MSHELQLTIGELIWKSGRVARGLKRLAVFGAVALGLILAPGARGQWLTQSFALKEGWNAIYLHVDTSHATLTELIDSDLSNPISEVWLWSPPVSSQQFVESPQLPTGANSQWYSWSRPLGATSALQRLNGNAACLVLVTNVASYVWHVKGKPAPPRNDWTVSGLNFMGFPARAAGPPFWEDFLAQAPELQQSIEVYRYPGGELGAGNPVRLFAFRTTPLNRGEAFWMRSGAAFNRYFGPFDLSLQSGDGAHFRDMRGQYRIRLRNAAVETVTVTAALLVSEAAPDGQTPIVGAPPVLVRGPLNLTNLTHGYSRLLEGPESWTLAPKGQPGSEVEVILGLNRSEMAGVAGDLFAAVLRFTDDLGLAQVDVPVSAEVASNAGLWVGSASVQYVSHYLKNFATAGSPEELVEVLDRLGLEQGADGVTYVRDENTGRILVFGGVEGKTGSYLLDGPVKVDSGAVARPFPLRLIIHNNGVSSRLLQRAHVGIGLDSNPVIATRESLLNPSDLEAARRISAVHLPYSAGNAPWPFAGAMEMGGSMTAEVSLSHDDHASNPFLHSYHPDHDNLDPLFENEMPVGVESYGVTRQITLNFTAPADDFSSLTTGGQTLTGDYVEVVTFHSRNGQSQQFHTLGIFALNRISNIGTLTTP